MEYKQLKKTLLLLAANHIHKNEQQTTERVTLAAILVANLSKLPTPYSQKDPQKDDRYSDGGEVGFDRGAAGVRSVAAEIGIDAGLDPQQLAQLLGVPSEELDQTLNLIAEDKARSALWSTLVGFRGFSSCSSATLDIQEPTRQRWTPYSKHLDPSSTLKAPNDPRKWHEQTQTTALTIKQKSDSGGFTKLVLLIDCSSSTTTLYQNKTVLGYIKDAAYSLIAYAKKASIPVATIGFSRDAWVIAKESKDYLMHAQRVFLLKPRGTTNLTNAVQLTTTVFKPHKALIALLTDGYVTQQDLGRLTEQTQANKVIAAIVNPTNQEIAEGIKNLKTLPNSNRVQLFEVRPDKAGKTIISLLPKSIC